MSQKFTEKVALNVVKFTPRAQGVSGKRLYMVRGRERAGDRPAYYVVDVPALKEALFLKACAHSLYLDLEEYGEIVESGFGKNAPEEVLAMFA